MKNLSFLFVALCFITCSPNAEKNKTTSFNPPTTKRIPVTDTYYGMEVADNYRWLENVKDSSVLQWLNAQSDYTNSRLDEIPGRDSLVAAFMRLDAMKPGRISYITLYFILPARGIVIFSKRLSRRIKPESCIIVMAGREKMFCSTTRE